MLSFIGTNLFPGGETFGKGPALDNKANAMKDGNAGILQAPESGGKRVWIAEWRRRGGHSGSDRWRSGCSNVRGQGKITSGGERRMRRGIIQVK